MAHSRWKVLKRAQRVSPPHSQKSPSTGATVFGHTVGEGKRGRKRENVRGRGRPLPPKAVPREATSPTEGAKLSRNAVPLTKKAPVRGPPFLGTRGRTRKDEWRGAGRLLTKNKLSLVGLPGGRCRNEHRRRSSTHKKAWGDGRSPAALRGREYGARRKALSRSGLPGKRQKKKPPGGGLGGQPISPERMAWASSLAK